MSGRKKSHREIQAETGTAGKKSKRKNEGRIGKIGPAGGSQTPNTEPTLAGAHKLHSAQSTGAVQINDSKRI
jgi:hypothetical protein